MIKYPSGKEGNGILTKLHFCLPQESPKRRQYTKKAFQQLPPLNTPYILDIGCGTGAATIELAKLSSGKIMGLDINQSFLDTLVKKAKKLSLNHKIQTNKQSLFTMDFPAETFDIIWAEGSIHIIGFRKGLKDWKIYLKPQGFLVIHEMSWIKKNPPKEIKDYWEKLYPGIKTIQENLAIIPHYGYEIIDYFPVSPDVWWEAYYGPLQEKIKKYRLKPQYTTNPVSRTILNQKQREIDLYHHYAQWYGSAFYIMEKK
jgi:ubiquinone/menaquinone biosynthesis C-methylase UbiE